MRASWQPPGSVPGDRVDFTFVGFAAGDGLQSSIFFDWHAGDDARRSPRCVCSPNPRSKSDSTILAIASRCSIRTRPCIATINQSRPVIHRPSWRSSPRFPSLSPAGSTSWTSTANPFHKRPVLADFGTGEAVDGHHFEYDVSALGVGIVRGEGGAGANAGDTASVEYDADAHRTDHSSAQDAGTGGGGASEEGPTQAIRPGVERGILVLIAGTFHGSANLLIESGCGRVRGKRLERAEESGGESTMRLGNIVRRRGLLRELVLQGGGKDERATVRWHRKGRTGCALGRFGPVKRYGATAPAGFSGRMGPPI
jgi:hypothetical protein